MTTQKVEGRCNYCGVRDIATNVGSPYCIRCGRIQNQPNKEKVHKSCWARRVVRREFAGNVMYGIHEVYFTDEKPDSLTKDPMFGYFDSLEELAEEVKAYGKCLATPVVEYSDIVKEESK